MSEIKNDTGLTNIGNYTFWTRAIIVYPFIKNYLKEKFYNSLIILEFNKIDMLVIDEELPIEIQSTQIDNRNQLKTISHASFEDRIRRQIEDNIINYNKCWFFFDAEYYRYLNDEANRSISINLDWLAKYVKDEKLKLFVVKYDGAITELKYKDLEFIRKLSCTCKIEEFDDVRILNRNKIKILSNILKGYKFTQYEIDIFREEFLERTKDKNNLCLFLIKSSDNRKKLYGYLLQTMGALSRVNTFLDGKMDSNSCQHGAEKIESVRLGIFEKNEHNDIRFVDKFDICQYFPSYNKNIKVWNKFKENNGYFNSNQLNYVYKIYKNNEKTLLDFYK